MAKPQCLAHQEMEMFVLGADQELSDAQKILRESHPDDSGANRSNYLSYLEAFRIRKGELLAHEAECEECQRED